MDKANIVYLKHIRDAIYRIETYTANLEENDFLLDNSAMARTAVVRELEIIGEAATHIDENFKTQHKEIPWRDMIDTRNKIIHDYMSVDYGLVWLILEKDLPVLKKQIEDTIGSY